MEAFISRITDAGPSAKRPPHMLLEPAVMSFSSRSLIALLLLGPTLGACDRQSAQKEQGNQATSGEVTSSEVTSGEAPASPAGKGNGKSYVIDTSKAGAEMPDFAFADEKGNDVTLQRFAGKPVLVNLWATWCAPCVAEMPQLDRIAGDYAKSGLQVLTISQDSMGADKVVPFFNKKSFKHIKPWLDPENHFAFHYATGLLPTSVLYTAQGEEVARISGALDWESKEAQSLIEKAING
jgi:thiol-disulfide isomerase/thioredoxin